MKVALKELASCMEGYADYLSKKRIKTSGTSTSCVSVSDSIHIQRLPILAVPPSDLKSLIDELSTRCNYDSVFVCDFSPDNHYALREIYKLLTGTVYRY